jgi:hypothetical protein
MNNQRRFAPLCLIKKMIGAWRRAIGGHLFSASDEGDDGDP